MNDLTTATTEPAMSFLSTSAILRQLLGLPPKEPSRIYIDRKEHGKYELYGWKITRKVYRTRKEKIVGNLYKTKEKKVIMEFQVFDQSKNMTAHTARMYESVSDALVGMKEMQRAGDK